LGPAGYLSRRPANGTKGHQTEPNGIERHQTAPNGTKRHETARNGTKRHAFLLIFGNIRGPGVA
jgi:hypothetical protein